MIKEISYIFAENEKQAWAELCQAQGKLWLAWPWFGLVGLGILSFVW